MAQPGWAKGCTHDTAREVYLCDECFALYAAVLPPAAAVRDEMAKDGWQIAEPVIAAVLRAVERIRERGV